MSDRLLHYSLTYGLEVVSILVTAVAVWRYRPQRAPWIWAAFVLLALGLVARTVHCSYNSDTWGCDFRFCWMAGAYAWEGKDPYSVTGYRPPNDDLVAFVYPPNTLPVFQLLALTPLSTAITLWAVFNIFICLSLGLVTRQALLAQDGERAQIIEPSTAALLAGPLVLSLAGRFAIECGQFSLLVTLAILGAMAAQTGNRGRPAIAAACLAVACVKPHTMLPFLILFLRRSDWRTWLYLALFLAILLLASGHPADLPNKVAAMLSANAAAREPGRINDYSILNHVSPTMIGFEYAFSRMAIEGRSTVSGLSLLFIAGLGVWLTYLVVYRNDIPRGACWSLVSLYSMLFLYHRLYDMVILIIPLVYCASRFRTSSGLARWCHAWALVAIVLALNAPYGEFFRFQRLHSSHPILTALFLPSATYVILSALAALALAVWLDLRRNPALSSPATCHPDGAAGPVIELQ